MRPLDQKTAVITGGSDGIGLAIARTFSQHGADILLVGRDQKKLSEAKAELSRDGGNVETISADLSRVDEVRSLGTEILKHFPRIDILVNNAAVAKFTPFETVDMEELDYQINLNVKSIFLLTQALLPSLKQTKGSIINISSMHAQRAIPGIPTVAYALTKGAINAFTRILAYELGPSGVRVNAIAPGNVLTDKVKAYVANVPEQDKLRFQGLIKTIYPLGRLGQPSEVGGIATYLASDQSAWVTGSIFNIDGGVTTN